MDPFDPISHIENSQLLLVAGEWPNFHDAEVHHLHIWRGDVRPEANRWIGTQIEAEFELCALARPFKAQLRFHDCDQIQLTEFNHQNALYDLSFAQEARGDNQLGEPLPPFITVRFEQAFGMALSFRCMRVEVVSRKEVSDATP